MFPSDLKSPEARRRISAARTALILDEPFFGTLALRLRLEESAYNQTAWVDGRTLGYNPAFVLSLSHAELIGLIEHEVMHCAAGHPWRRGGRDHRRFNEAADRAINPILRDAGVKLPEGGLFELDPSHHGKSAEWIYDRLPPAQPAPSPSPSSGQGSGQGQGQPARGSGSAGSAGAGNGPENDPKTTPGTNTPPKGHSTMQAPPDGAQGQPEVTEGVCPPDTRGRPEGQEQICDGPLGEVRDAPAGDGTGADDAPTEAEWQHAAQQAATLAKGRGNLPAGLQRFTKDTAQGRVDWRSAMRRFAQEVAHADYSWVRPNQRYAAHGLILPALHSHQLGVLAVGVDTSGSIDQVLLAQFAAEIRAVADEVHPRQIRVLYCDTRVAREEVFEQGDPIALHAAGGGGTDFRPVFRAIEAWEEEPVAVIYLTDLYGVFPEVAPPWPTLWVTGDDRERAVPFGEVVAAA